MIIEKRMRVLVTDTWGEWLSTTDVPPYINTNIVEYRVQNTVDISYVTDNVTTVSSDNTTTIVGSGIFDDIMETINTHIDSQFTNGRITGAAYAEVYLGMMQSVLAESVKVLLSKDTVGAEVELKSNQAELVSKQTLTEEKKALLVARQTKGFDDDAKQKLLKQALDSWAVAYSVAKDANSIPDSIKVDSIDSVMKSAMEGLSVDISTNPLGLA